MLVRGARGVFRSGQRKLAGSAGTGFAHGGHRRHWIRTEPRRSLIWESATKLRSENMEKNLQPRATLPSMRRQPLLRYWPAP